MATLVYSDANGVDRSFALGAEPVTVGRSSECSIRSDDPRVSRVHARFYLDNGSLWVEDLGSSNGIYVGPNKVSRSPVPIGEIVLVGSLMIRLVPESGTMPPPMGLHGTLATWLDLERKARAAVEEERNAFAQRVGQLHVEIAALATAATAPPPPEPAPLPAPEPVPDPGYEEAQRRVSELERELEAARSAATPLEAARVQSQAEARALREELDQLRRASHAELEVVRLSLAKAKETTMIADATAGVEVASALAEADVVIADLRKQLAAVRAPPGAPDVRVADLDAAVTTLTARADKAEKDLAAAQIRAQGAERNLAHATTQAAKAETRSAQLQQAVADAETRGQLDAEAQQQLRERIATLETRVGAGDAPLLAVETRASKLVAELAETTERYETARGRIADLEREVETARAATKATETRAVAAESKLELATGKLAEAAKREASLTARMAELAGAEAAIAAATAAREAATTRAAASEARVLEAERRAEELDKRASAADTMAKAMAKDVAEALRRSAEVESRARATVRETAELTRRATAAEAALAPAELARSEAAATLATVQRSEAELRDKLAAAEQAGEGRVGATLTKLKTEHDAALAGARDALAAATERHTAMLQAARDEGAAALVAVREQLAGELEQARREAAGVVETTRGDAAAALEAARRDLAIERTAAAVATERRAAFERDALAAAEQLAAAQERAELAERKLVEDDITIEALQDRVTDLESGMAVSETSMQSSLQDAREEVAAVRRELVDARATSARAAAELGALRAQHDVAVREALAEANAETEAAVSAAKAESDEQLSTLVARADEADAAIGHSAALQRQLEEALGKLAHLEQEAEHEAGQLRNLQDQLREAEARVLDAEDRAQDAIESSSAARDARARADAAQGRLADAESLLALSRDRVKTLEAELSKADNVRSFAAETEREIAQLQRELREVRSKLTQVTLQRDNLAAQVRGDDETTGRRPLDLDARGELARRPYDPEATAQADVAKLEPFIARASELQQKVTELEAVVAEQRSQLAAPDIEAESTRTNGQFNVLVAEHVNVLEEAIDSLRANMRAASDETAVMDQTESVVVVASAVSQAAEHIERARTAIRALSSTIGAS